MGKPHRPLTDAQIKAWLKARIEMTLNNVMLHVYKYDEASITKDELRAMVKMELATQIEQVYDVGFEDGVHGSVDVEDEDNPVKFEIDEEDEDED